MHLQHLLSKLLRFGGDWASCAIFTSTPDVRAHLAQLTKLVQVGRTMTLAD